MGFLYRITSHTTEGFQTACRCRNLCYYFVVLLHYYFSFGPFHYLARGSGGEVLWWVCLCVCLSVSLCVCLSTRICSEPHAQSLPVFFCMLPMAVAWSSSAGWQHPKGKGQFWGFSSPLKMHCNTLIANNIMQQMGPFHRCRGMLGVHSACDAFAANNVMQQKGSFHCHRRVIGVHTQCGRSVIYDCLVPFCICLCIIHNSMTKTQVWIPCHLFELMMASARQIFVVYY